MRIRYLVTLFIFAMLWSGCTSQPDSVTVVSSPTLKLTVTQKPKPTDTPSVLPVPTAPIVSSPTPFSSPIYQVCVSASQEIPENTNGVLVLYHLDSDLNRSVMLHDVNKKQEKSLIPLGWLASVWGVSPDRRFLLYEYDTGGADEYRLAVTNSQGKVVADFDDRVAPESWWDYSNWHDTNLLRVVIIDLTEERTLPRLYNIFTGEYTPLKTDYPNAYKGDNLDWGLDSLAIDLSSSDGANIVYDPTLTRVLYPKRGQIVSLTNVETGHELASIQLPKWGRLPRWSDDGEHLVLIASASKAAVGHDEFFIVSRNGPVFQRLTYLTEQFDTVHISDYAWSPDGKRIAFWLNTKSKNPTLEGTQSELAVVDIQSGEITRLCIEGISAPMRHEIQMTHTQPVWSPDGRQIAFAQLDSSKVNTYNVMVVDLETQTVFKVATNKEPIGWMIKEP